MNTHYTYFWVDFLSFIFPFIFSFHPAFRFYKFWRAIIPSLIIPASIFIVWDILFTHWNIWWFNSDYTFAPRFVNLPFEEILFFICIPYACLFTYHCVRQYLGNSFFNWIKKSYLWVFVILLTTVSVLNFSRLYTSVTFLGLAIFITFLLLRKANYLHSFFLSFILILPFFFLTNGILTGSFIYKPVVNYNPAHNLGIRLFTIPFEDVFYGMLLLMMNVGLFEYLINKSKVSTRN